jgi:hypothetical protein
MEAETDEAPSSSAKLYHDDRSKTYEEYPDAIEQIKANASATPSVGV